MRCLSPVRYSKPRPRLITRGFTLIEVLVVLMLLGLLAGLVVPNLIGRSEQASKEAAEAEIQRLGMAIEAYYLDTGQVPARLADLVEQPASADAWNGPYAQQSTLQDPWGEPYRFRHPGEHRRFDLFSVGPDGTRATEDDIVNWD